MRTCPSESGWTYMIRDHSRLKEGSSRFLTITKPLTRTFHYDFYHDFAMSANNLSTKSTKSALAWLARAAIAIVDTTCILQPPAMADYHESTSIVVFNALDALNFGSSAFFANTLYYLGK